MSILVNDISETEFEIKHDYQAEGHITDLGRLANTIVIVIRELLQSYFV